MPAMSSSTSFAPRFVTSTTSRRCGPPTGPWSGWWFDRHLTAPPGAVRCRSNHHPLHGPVGGPHLLEVVEVTNLGAKDVDDDIAGIDQHPVALGQSFDAGAAIAFILQLFDEVVGDGADMPLRATRGEHHVVAD